MRAIILSLLLLFCAGPAAFAKTDHIMPSLPVYPEYPDEHAEYIKSGTVTFSLTLNGKDEHDLGDGERLIFVGNASAEETLTLTPSGGTRHYSFHGMSRFTTIHKDGKKETATFRQSDGNSVNVPEMQPGQGVLGPVVVSDKLKCVAACLSVPYWASHWGASDLKGEVTFETPDASSTGPFPGMFTARIPLVGKTDNVLSRTMNAWEASGKEDGITLASSGYVECPWQNGGCSGSITVPVKAACMGYSYQVNTPLVTDAMFSPEMVEANKLMMIPGSLSVTWALNTQPAKSKMTIAPVEPEAYEKWLPFPKFEQEADTMPLAIQAEMVAEKEGDPEPSGRIDFYLRNVSKQKGECGNFPRDRAEKYDLRFADEQPEGIKVDEDGQHAYTDEPVSKAIVLVSAEDGGAYGSVQATCDDQHLIAEDPSTGRRALAVPKDKNENHVADAWEEEKGVLDENLPMDWDESEVDGQSRKGDGMTLYDKFRGLCVLSDTGRVYKRFRPKQKYLLVIDSGNVFDCGLWKHASGFEAYKLDESLVQGGGDSVASRLVNYCTENGHKYAVRIEVLRGYTETSPLPDMDPNAMKQYGYTQQEGDSPKTALRVRIFPDRIAAMIDRMVTSVENGVANPNSEDGDALFNKARISGDDAKQALDRCDGAARSALARQVVTLAAIHETAHACGLDGHLNASGDEDEESPGPSTCPMQYFNQVLRRELIVRTINNGGLGNPLPLNYEGFCVTDPWHCYKDLNVKDE